MKTFLCYLLLTNSIFCLIQINPDLFSQPVTSLSDDQIHQTIYKARSEVSGRCTYTYDENGKIIISLLEKEIDGEWTPFSRIKEGFDTRKNKIYKLEEVFRDGNWTNSSKLENTYDEMDHNIFQIRQIWKDEKWVNSSKYETLYNEKGKILKNLQYKWINDEWQLVYSGESTYDDNGNPIVSSLKSWEDGKLMLHARVTYTYNQANKLISFSRETLVDSVMVFIDRISDVYDDAGNYLYQLTEIWDTDKWVNSKRSTTLFDQEGAMIGQLDEVFVNEEWIHSLRSTMTKDTLGLVNQTLYEKWINDQWIHFQKINYSYYNDSSQEYAHTLYWDGGKWLNLERSSTTRNSLGLKSAFIYEKWNEEGKPTSESFKYEYEYRNDSSYRSLDYNTWQGDGWAPSNTTLIYVDKSGNLYSHNFCYHMDMIYLSEVDVPEIIHNPDFIVSPNPANNFIELSSIPTVTQNINYIRIYDVSGNLLLLEPTFELEKQRINISSLPPGSYIIVHGDRLGRFVKE